MDVVLKRDYEVWVFFRDFVFVLLKGSWVLFVLGSFCLIRVIGKFGRCSRFFGFVVENVV